MAEKLGTETEVDEQILDKLGYGVMIFDAKRRLRYANNAARRIVSAELKPGQQMPTNFPADRVRDESGTPVSAENLPIARAYRGESVANEVFQYIERNGEHRWLCVASYPRYENGELTEVVATYEDISEKRRRDARLTFMVESSKILTLTEDFRSRLVQKARLAVPSLADWCAIDIVNAAGAIERVAVINEDPEQLRLIQEFERKYPTDPTNPTSPASVIRTMQAQFVPLITEETLRAATMSLEQLEEVRKLSLKSFITVPVIVGGKGLGCLTLAYAKSGRVYTPADFEFFKEYSGHLSVLFDNSQLYHEIRRRDTAKDLFLASLSHELRNPLAPIKSALELLKLKPASAEIREELDVIEHQFAHLAKLLNDLLDVSRFTQATITIDPKPIDLRNVVERSLKATDALLRTADITLHFSYPSCPVVVSADETRLEQAVINLVNNAIKYTPAGGSIWVDVESDAAETPTAIIRVRDNGAGISPEDLPNIFEMYYQGRRRMHISSGLGIGLLLVNKIIELHGGSIEAESEGLGLGSQFTVRLPVSEQTAEQKQYIVDADAIRGKRILVVDDNESAANSLAKLLNRLGARAEALYSGREALERELVGFDLLLLDIGMPQMDGYQLVKALRERGVAHPIVALTGYGLSEDRERALAAGFSSHLTKPVGIDDISRVVSEVFGAGV